MSRRRSLSVTAPLVATTALAILTGCKKQEMQRCVDEKNQVVADSFCQNQPLQQQQPVGGHSGGFIPVFPMYRYYYGGGGGYTPGSIVTGGGYAPIAGRSYSSPSVSRGGFGKSFSSSGS